MHFPSAGYSGIESSEGSFKGEGKDNDRRLGPDAIKPGGLPKGG